MAVSRHDAAAVIDNGVVAVAGDPACGRNRAGGRRNDGCAGRRRDVLALVELAGAVNRMDTPAISAGGNSVARQRPGERAAVTGRGARAGRRDLIARGALLLCGRCCCGCRRCFLARLLGDLVAYGVHFVRNALVLGLLLLLVGFQALLKRLLLCLAGLQLLGLVVQVVLILDLLVLRFLEVITLLLNVLLGCRILRDDLLVVVHDGRHNVETVEQIGEARRVEQHLEIADVALLVGRADGLREILLLRLERLLCALELGGLDVDLLLEALDVRLYGLDLLLGEGDLLLERGTGLFDVADLACGRVELLLDLSLLVLERGELVLELCARGRARINDARGNDRHEHCADQNACNSAGYQAYGFLFHHMIVLLVLRHP